MSENRMQVKFPKINVLNGWNTIDLKKFEEIGFEFTDIPGDEEYLLATLPEGWRLEQVVEANQNCYELFDNNGFLRAKNCTVNIYTHTPEKVGNSTIFKVTAVRKSPAMDWKTRYRVFTIPNDINSGMIVFGNSEETIYAHPFNSSKQWSFAMWRTDNWIRENYSHYGSPFYYWDINLEKAPQRILGTQKTDK